MDRLETLLTCLPRIQDLNRSAIVDGYVPGEVIPELNYLNYRGAHKTAIDNFRRHTNEFMK